MSAADEIALVDTSDRTHTLTAAAVDTFFVINMRKVVGDGNSTLRTHLLAFAAADTAVCTVFAH